MFWKISLRKNEKNNNIYQIFFLFIFFQTFRTLVIRHMCRGSHPPPGHREGSAGVHRAQYEVCLLHGAVLAACRRIIQIAAMNSDVAAGRPQALLYLGPDERSQRMAIRRYGRKYFSIDPKNRYITLCCKLLIENNYKIEINI